MRFGWIPHSFGRIVNFYAGSLVLVKNKDSFTEDYCRLKDTRWIFPERERFPFLYSELNKLINISNSTSLKPYNFVTKWRGSRFFASSLDDFIEYTFKGYGNSSLGNNLQVGCLYSDWVTEKVEKLRTDSRGIVGFYARDDAWDVSIGHSLSQVIVRKSLTLFDSVFLTIGENQKVKLILFNTMK